MILRPTQRKAAAHGHSVVSGRSRMKTPSPESSVHLGVVMPKKTRPAGSVDPTSRSKAIHHARRQIGNIGKAQRLTQRCLRRMHFNPYLKISQNRSGPSAPPHFLNPPKICGLDKPSRQPSSKTYQHGEPEGPEDQSVQPKCIKKNKAVPL